MDRVLSTVDCRLWTVNCEPKTVTIDVYSPPCMDLTQVLKKHFGFDTFRPLQQEVIETLMNNKDVLLLMPTGGGKSVCFQLPALLKEGTALVISPLIALM